VGQKVTEWMWWRDGFGSHKFARWKTFTERSAFFFPSRKSRNEGRFSDPNAVSPRPYTHPLLRHPHHSGSRKNFYTSTHANTRLCCDNLSLNDLNLIFNQIKSDPRLHFMLLHTSDPLTEFPTKMPINSGFKVASWIFQRLVVYLYF